MCPIGVSILGSLLRMFSNVHVNTYRDRVETSLCLLSSPQPRSSLPGSGEEAEVRIK